MASRKGPINIYKVKQYEIESTFDSSFTQFIQSRKSVNVHFPKLYSVPLKMSCINRAVWVLLLENRVHLIVFIYWYFYKM